MNHYCKHCKRFVIGTTQDYSSYSDYCKYPLKESIDDPIYGKYTNDTKDITTNDPNYPNKNGDCEYYKEKMIIKIINLLKDLL